jgi:glycosyltransferase involved in cell wall biosynthesis
LNTPIRLLTNSLPLQAAPPLAVADGAGIDVVATRGFGGDARRVLRGEIDAVLIEGAPGELLRWCALRKAARFKDFRLLSLDYLPSRPRTTRQRARLALIRWLLQEVDEFLVYQREASGFCEVLGVAPERVRYVPFKVNRIDALAALRPTDNGTFLSCGRSFRDYATLCEAFRGLDHECRILAQWSEIEQHGTRFDGIDVPPNVKLISDDGTMESWYSIMSQARAVILPIDPDTLFPAGIGTYLGAMALGKCVIITEGPGTIGVLDEGQAVVVPPRDAVALRAAVRRVASDDAYRERVANAGQRYALALGGEERLARDVLAAVGRLAARGDAAETGASSPTEAGLAADRR